MASISMCSILRLIRSRLLVLLFEQVQDRSRELWAIETLNNKSINISNMHTKKSELLSDK